MKKFIFTSMIIGTALAASVAFAAPSTNTKPHLTMGNIKDGINCQSYTTDLCIENFTNGKIFFSVPQFGYNYVKIPANEWVDVSSDVLYHFLNLKLFDNNKIKIFDQLEPNHSVVPVGIGKSGNPIVGLSR